MSLSSVLDTAVNKDKSPHAYRVHVELLEEGDEAKTKQGTVEVELGAVDQKTKCSRVRQATLYTGGGHSLRRQHLGSNLKTGRETARQTEAGLGHWCGPSRPREQQGVVWCVQEASRPVWQKQSEPALRGHRSQGDGSRRAWRLR